METEQRSFTSLVTMQFPCPTCTASFTAAHNLRRHQRTVHDGLKAAQCPFPGCPRAFQTAQNLRRHQLTHEELKPFACHYDQCTFTTITAQNLDIHMNIHTGERPFACLHEGCGQTFTQPAHLVTHTRTHTGEKPFVCTYQGCTYRTGQSSHLTRHELVHTGENPCACDAPGCDYVGKTNQNLLLHQRRYHTNERPFHCLEPNCTRQFCSRGEMKAHMFSHNPEPRFRCQEEGCDAAYPFPQSLQSHIESHHTEAGQQRKKKKEAKIKKLLDDHNIPYKAQHHIDFRCVGPNGEGSRCFIDFLIEVRDSEGKVSGFIFLEVDEQQHDAYAVACEVRRMADVYESLTVGGNTFPVAFVRYNPDRFEVEEVLVKVPTKTRQARLLNVLKTWTFKQPFSVLYMFYDTIDELPAVFTDPSYNEAFKDACIGCIIE